MEELVDKFKQGLGLCEDNILVSVVGGTGEDNILVSVVGGTGECSG